MKAAIGDIEKITIDNYLVGKLVSKHIVEGRNTGFTKRRQLVRSNALNDKNPFLWI